MPLEQFHPAVARWFSEQFSAPTEAQARAWPAIKEGKHALIAAPTGSGKTLSAFLAAIDDLVKLGLEGSLEDRTHVVYVSPLKALSNDIQRNLQVPLEGILQELWTEGLVNFNIRTLVRTGDTPAAERTAMIKRPPHILVTTPESLYILLTSEGGRRMLRTARTLIVDEIHALVGDKRGSHFALSMERLEALAGDNLIRIGLSATQRPIEEVARYLVGAARIAPDGTPDCTIIDTGHARDIDLAIEVPRSPLEAVMPAEVWEEVYDRIAELISEHRTTLVFVNTRRMAERVCRHLGERIGDENVTSHHGSLARDRRLDAEQRLKSGQLRVLVATASLELGIDIGSVDLVCQLGTTRSIATLLQRVGRSGHTVGGSPKGRLFPLSRDELVECAALVDSIRRGELDRLIIPQAPLDILAQQIVAAVACEEWTEDGLFEIVRRAYPFRDLSREDFDKVVAMLAAGFSTRRGRHGSHVHHDAVNHRLRGRRGARLTAITSGGAIPDNADYDVVLEPAGALVGTVNEDFAIESMGGDIFQLGNASWRILRIERGKVRVEDAQGQPPTIPFWFGEAPSRTQELSAAVSRLRTEVAEKIDLPADADPGKGVVSEPAMRYARSVSWLAGEVGISDSAARQIAEYLAAAKAALGVMPSQQTLVMERFFDESGGTQLVIHSPFGGKLNRAWGLSLRKRFCRKFNFELQAAATEDAIVLSLAAAHSFPLEDVFHYLHSASVRDLLIQALLDAPMFNIRWRWNAGRALAVLRWRGGKKVPPQFQRMDAEDLVAALFPDQIACFENLVGPREIPDHPLVQQTICDCLEEAMDIDRLEALLASIERGEKMLVARELTEPSPLAAEILSARPYAFLDDAPLEERRTQAVMSRRWLDPQSAADLGRLDLSAIERVRQEAWPIVSNADELHDALVQLGFLTADEGASGLPSGSNFRREDSNDWRTLLAHLVAEHRATIVRTSADGPSLWVAAERLAEIAAVFPSATLHPPLDALGEGPASSESALAELVRSRLEGLGPSTATAIAESMGLFRSPVRSPLPQGGTECMEAAPGLADIEAALIALEAEGYVMRGSFTPKLNGSLNGSLNETEWCVRRLLARIHRYTINRLRQEIEPVSGADFMRFLFAWQKVAPDHRGEGIDTLAVILEQLEGFEAPAAAWEEEILPCRLGQYDPAWLDSLCLSGRIVWSRLASPKGAASSPIRSTPISLVSRKNAAHWTVATAATGTNGSSLSSHAQLVYGLLGEHGASFFSDLVAGSSLLRCQVEEALAELVAGGLVTADSFAGLRALLTPSNRRPVAEGVKRRGSVAQFGIEDAGRWSRLPRLNSNGNLAAEEDKNRLRGANGRRGVRQAYRAPDPASVETIALTLLRRYGVVFRRLLDRENLQVPWRDILGVYRRMEARGELRGGRFVAGFSGEQFALPEAIGSLRSMRKLPGDGTLISLSAADPLNLAGIITPGAKVPVIASNRILYRDGIPIAILQAGEISYLEETDSAARWQLRNALVRRNAAPPLRAEIGHPA